MKKTLLASALMLAFSASTFASEYNWVDIPDGTETYRPEDPAGQHDPIIPVSSLQRNDRGEFVYSSKASLDTFGSNGVSLLRANSGETVVNGGSLWIKGEKNDAGRSNGSAMTTSVPSAGNVEGGTIINRGTFYVDGWDPNQVKAMNVNPGGTAINEGIIVVKGGAAMEDSSGAGNKTIINKKVINVIGAGIGIHFRKEGGDAVDVSNSGTILVTGSGTGVHIGDSDPSSSGSAEGKQFTNSGSIIASGEGSTAIKVKTEERDVVLNFEDKSQVDGLVDANSHTTLNFTGNTDTIELADDAQAINVDSASNITIRQGTDTGLDIDSVTTSQGGSTSFELTRLGTTGDKVLTIGTAEGDISVGYTGNVSDDLVQGADANDLFNGIQIRGQDLTTVTVDEGAWGNALVATKDENGVHLRSTSTNSLLSSTKDVALTAALMWRSQLTNLTDRLGTLRTLPQAAGGWARYNNGRLEGRGIEHDYNTIEVGFDAPVSNNFLVGVSFDYTFGDTDIAAGTSDNDTYALGLYGTYFSESGSFLDLMAKIGRIDAEYDLDNGIHEKADYMMTGAIVGVEGGHRFDLSHNMFVEPQVQLTYSWLRASSYSTDIRTVDLETMESLIARVGFMGGVKFNENRGAAYLKASYNHDFLGDVDAKFSGVVDGKPIALGINDELDDNWGEVSLGASYNVTDSVHAFIDVGTSFGGDIDQKWRVNFGGRYVF